MEISSSVVSWVQFRSERGQPRFQPSGFQSFSLFRGRLTMDYKEVPDGSFHCLVVTRLPESGNCANDPFATLPESALPCSNVSELSVGDGSILQVALFL